MNRIPDYSYLSTLSLCARKAYFAYERGLVRIDDESPYLRMGSALHHGIDHLYTSEWDVDGAVRKAVEYWDDFPIPPLARPQWFSGEFAEGIIRNFAQDRHDDPITPLRLHRDDLRTNLLGDTHGLVFDDAGNVALAEAALTVKFPNGLTYGGKIDLPCVIGGSTAIIDHKTSSQWLSESWAMQYAYSHQMRNYVGMMRLLTGEAYDRCYISGIYTGKEALDDDSKWSKRTTQRSALFGPYIYSDQHIEESQQWAMEWMNLRNLFAESGMWPQNDKACLHFGKACEFYELCRRSPHVREAIIKQQYTVREFDGLLASGADSNA